MSLFTRGAVALATFAIVAGSVVTATNAAAEPVVDTPTANAVIGLALANGWTPYSAGTRTPTATRASGIVVLKGAIGDGTGSTAFTLPPGYRPAATVYVPVDMCNATTGRLIIQASGVTSVEASTEFGNAQCFTSLEGVAFPVSTVGFTALTTINGWTGAPFGTRSPGVKLMNGKAVFKGAVATSGSNSSPFVLPAGFRPKTTVFVKVDLCGASNGRLVIQPSGTVTVSAEGDFADAQCFTSLEGVSYAPGSNNYTALPLLNGWTGTVFGTRAAAIRSFNGNISLQGAISTSGSSANPFTIPAGFRPSGTIFVPVDMCGATNGRLVIQPSGAVTLQAETDFTDAACFTSLESVVWRKP